jgi:autotransporter-associated beta strand protein
MQIIKPFKTISLSVALLAAALATASAQTTATWNNGAADNNWNTAGNWDIGVPAEGTNAVIGAGFIVSNSTPMIATSFATLNLAGNLTVDAAGFNIDPGLTSVVPLTTSSTTVLNITPNGVMTIRNATNITVASLGVVTNAGTWIMTNTGAIILPNATGPTNALTFNAGSVFIMTNTAGSAGITVGASSSSQGAVMTINGGTVTLDKLLSIAGIGSRVFVRGGTLNCNGSSRVNDASNDGADRIDVSGGVANLGNFSVSRTTSAGGLVAANAIVNATGIQIGTGNSTAFATVNNGAFVTNTGVFNINDSTNSANSGERRQMFLIRGGTVVSTGVNGIVLANQSELLPNAPIANNGVGGVLDINGGSLTAEKITLIKDGTITNNYARLDVTGPGIVYLGSGGIVANTGLNKTAFNIVLTNGILAAKASWASVAPMAMVGGATFQAADVTGAPFDIGLTNVLSGGSASLTKTGGGVLTLGGTNTYTANTTISTGTLALGPNGSILTSVQIGVASGATFDVTAQSGFSLTSAQTLVGDGTVAGTVTATNGATISPGTGAIGKLTFSGSLTETNAKHTFELSSTTNDSITVVGALNLGGTNVITFLPLGNLPLGTYKLFSYGSLVGDVTNFSFSGAPGRLTNNVASKTISLVTTGVRGATTNVWVGGTPNNWDVLTSATWSNSVPDVFANGDTVIFNAIGAANPNVNIVGSVLPAAVTVDASANYIFSGTGSIGGTSGLTKTNTGTLTILATNSYSGATAISGGTVEAITIANAGASSSIGAASGTGSGLLVLDSGALRYLGGTASSDRGATLNAGGGVIDVTNSATTLTVGGTVTGSGALTKVGPGTLTISAANNYSGGTVISNGVLQINANNGAGSGAITNEGRTFRLNGALTVDNAMQFDNNCVIELNGVGSGNVPMRGAWSGGGTVNVNFLTQNSSQTYSLGGEGAVGGNMTNFYGTVNFGTNSGFVRLNNNATFNLGSSNATFNLGTGTTSFSQRNGNTTSYLGALIGGPNTKLTGSKSDVHGLETYVIGGNNLSTVFAGTITNGTAANDTLAIVKVGSGTLTLSGTNYATQTTIVQGGTLQVDGRIINSAVTVQTGAALTGNGSLNSVDVQANGVLSPGTSGIGQLTINTLTLESGCTNIMEVNKSLGTNDAVVGLSSISYGGTLTVTNLSGTLTNGTVFKLFSAQSYNGGFDGDINLPVLGPGLFWQTNLAVDGTIRIPPLTNAFAITSVLSGMNLTLSWPGTSTGWMLEVQTNDITIGLTGVWAPVPNSDLVNSYTVTIDPANPSVFYRMSYTAP